MRRQVMTPAELAQTINEKLTPPLGFDVTCRVVDRLFTVTVTPILEVGVQAAVELDSRVIDGLLLEHRWQDIQDEIASAIDCCIAALQGEGSDESSTNQPAS